MTTVAELAHRIAHAVSADPAVARLDAGSLGLVATYVPGGKVAGVRVASPTGPVVLGVVLYLDRPLPEVTARLRELVRSVAGDMAVNVEVAGVVSTVDDAGELPPR
ncbi:hypothetical protein [Prauserella flavalba]|uniref:Asp23/Gls24 family envelope stress response protein n=1 Tax=Prauserella flavalba TaxID=1477506 RepID=A0A318LMC5_9PSEU|nr:hypothetical protein [Prauserella flavalba]PXY30531.1 hypothetical protein BA062_18395 [Prauserella flavalba]